MVLFEVMALGKKMPCTIIDLQIIFQNNELTIFCVFHGVDVIMLLYYIVMVLRYHKHAFHMKEK